MFSYNYKLVLSYHGLCFHGTAIQPGYRTVQGELERVLSLFFAQKITTFWAARLDRGVHAYAQVASFQTQLTYKLPPHALHKFLTRQKWSDLQVLKVVAKKNFHARFHAVSKVYRYVLDTSNQLKPPLMHLVWHLQQHVDYHKMTAIAELFIGHHNFWSFSTATQEKVHHREIISIKIIRKGNNQFIFEVHGVSFLRSMVRMIVAAIVYYGTGLLSLDFIKDCLCYPCKGKIVFKAPAAGLFLLKVNYN